VSVGPLGVRTRLAMALRAECLQATWNYERQQGIGWAWALQPALERLYPDAVTRRERLAEHTAYFNTQPTMCSVALGAVASLEARRAAGQGPDADTIARVKTVLGSSLAALGDRLFWFTLRPFAGCLGVLLALHGSSAAAAVQWLTYNAAHQGVRVAGIGWGLGAGPAVVDDAFRRRFERVIRGLGIAGAALIGAIVAVLLVPDGQPRPLVWQATLGAGLTLGLLSAPRPRPSPTEWAVGVGALCVIAGWMR
jgi:PTS system mannose-specific IID component